MEWVRVRTVLNWVNLSTPAGLALARAGRCRPRRYDGGLWVAEGWRAPLPKAGAFTVGSVVVLRPHLCPPEAHPGLMGHEAAHASQYAVCGPLFLPLYFAAAGWSWLRTGDAASQNLFERRAGLVRGGYREAPPLPLRARASGLLRAGTRAAARAIPSRRTAL
ncbi:hypothetical protein [Zhihengliuella flava]|uniref:DUF4157 domain-containing protein n=1 Tax=Zhihengliuella flava TaxID=1285193 RepID=A0A931GEN5_9MICC|nr:hypothetical protein [Zhihengliuella flava]MBG6083747.1 hypothetical protein [Zhihengliuella flava]